MSRGGTRKQGALRNCPPVCYGRLIDGGTGGVGEVGGVGEIDNPGMEGDTGLGMAPYTAVHSSLTRAYETWGGSAGSMASFWLAQAAATA